ncbi:alpha/beta hydrolase [Natrarchaeobius oligotrophus]|uniref:Alpha/beta hydrolase n=1 Tax=Natrarchaeobius chitinivorans TaxID=1679083 RepID=A0A3N6MDG3_NATCH|nr:alpha/beta hydrolase [Natrarchaeobius chitinivorans]RQG98804.1 alpha/beta hydrolase [Natrarchaeobius chitinivorans]
MSDVVIPGGRDVRGTLEQPAGEPSAIVVACPPHPRYGGSRSDRRLVAISSALAEAGIDCLRFDYGTWDEGYGEREDVRNAVRWARERYARVGLFGYSFGATQALLASADVAVDAVAVLAPSARIDANADLDAVDALGALESPARVLYGERDETVEWGPVVERADERGPDVTTVALSADHFFVGQDDAIAESVREFFERTLLE